MSARCTREATSVAFKVLKHGTEISPFFIECRRRDIHYVHDSGYTVFPIRYFLEYDYGYCVRWSRQFICSYIRLVCWVHSVCICRRWRKKKTEWTEKKCEENSVRCAYRRAHIWIIACSFYVAYWFMIHFSARSLSPSNSLTRSPSCPHCRYYFPFDITHYQFQLFIMYTSPLA